MSRLSVVETHILEIVHSLSEISCGGEHPRPMGSMSTPLPKRADTFSGFDTKGNENLML